MKNIGKALIYCCLFLTLIGCAGKSESLTDFDVKIAGLTALNDYSAGGAFIIGKQSDGEGRFLKRIDNDNSDVLSLELPNGTWDFHVIMWDGDHDGDGIFTDATPAYTGIVRCGSSPANILDGSDLTVALSASNTNCADPIWGTPMVDDGTSRGINRFEFTSLFHCAKSLNEVTESADCTGPAKGFLRSGKVGLTPYLQLPGEGLVENKSNSLSSPCLNGSGASDSLLSNGEVIDSSPTIPHFPWGPGLRISLQGFFKPDCDSTDRGLVERTLPNGFAVGASGVKLYSALKEAAIYTPDSLACAPPRGSLTTDFSVEIAGPINAYGICNKEQFALIPPEFTSGRMLSNKIINLYRDIDFFEGQTITVDNPPNVPNFPMIGDDFSSAKLASGAYNGTFDGRGHRITGLTIALDDDSADISDIGFVRRLGAGGKIKNLTFILPEVDTSSYYNHADIGIVAGIVNGGRIENVSIIAGSVQGRQRVGLFAGHSTSSSTFKFLDSRFSEVEGARSIGGIVGNDTSGIFEQVEFQGSLSIEANGHSDGFCNDPTIYDSGSCTGAAGPWRGYEDFGGLIGRSMSSTIRFSTSKGILIGGVNNGGIAGSMEAGLVEDSYSIMGVIGTKHGIGTEYGNTGGLVGQLHTAPSTLRRVFHTLGTVAHPTSDPTKVNSDYGTFGGATPTAVDVVVSAGLVPTVIEYNDFRKKTNMEPFGFDGTNGWRMDDDLYDVPVLAWEPTRRCSGKFASTFAGGDGTAANPYLICNAQQLENMSATFDVVGKHYRLARPIDASKISTLNIGDGSLLPNAANLGRTFRGTLDGDGHFIYNAGIEFNTSNPEPHGLIAEIGNEGVVKNLNLVGSALANHADDRPLGLVAGLNAGRIERVNVFGSVDATAMTASMFNSGVGGIVGVNHGEVVASQSYASVKGNRFVGGIAGINEGGLILYSLAEGKISPARVDRVAERIGGIVGSNLKFAGDKSFVDEVHGKPISYNGDIQQSSFNGTLTPKLGNLPGDEGIFYEAGLIAGRNEGTIKDISIYGIMDLNLATYPIYKGNVFDPAGAPGTIADNEAYVIDTMATSTAVDGSLTHDWDIGDIIYKKGTNAPIRIPTGAGGPNSAIDDNVAVANTTIVSPFFGVGFITGYNGNNGVIENAYVGQNSSYTGVEYFGPSFGYLTGYSEAGSSVMNTVFEGDFNFPGANDFLATWLSDNNYFIQRGAGGPDKVVTTIAGTNYDGGTTITAPVNLMGYGLTNTNLLALGPYSFMPNGPVFATTITPSGPKVGLASAGTYDLHIPDMDFTTANYSNFFLSTMSWDAGPENSGAVWAEEPGTKPRVFLSRIWRYPDYFESLDYITLVNGGAPSSIGLDTLFVPEITSITSTYGGSPAEGPAMGGNIVTIAGSNLLPAGTITIGGVDCININALDANTVECTAGAVGPGTYGVSVTNRYGEITTIPNAYTYVAGPAPSTITPGTLLSSAGGETITITGSNFGNVVEVTVGGVPCLGLNIMPTVITCTAPAGSPGGKMVSIQDIYGQTDGSQSVTYP